jgi:rifampicin phosphotransferase
MNTFTVNFQEIDRSDVSVAGGKGANLGELFKIQGINVPAGFCVTVAAYNTVVANNPELNHLLDKLSSLTVQQRESIVALSATIRLVIETIPVPKGLANAVGDHLRQWGDKDAFAVRSSATAEDLPTASFAGQQESFLNIIGKESILQHISKCWASLFTDRAILYRIKNEFDHRKVQLSVVIQKMVGAEVSGVMFTADPLTSNRKLVSIDAGFGLGEALVSGLVSPDLYKVANGRVIEKTIAAGNHSRQALTDEQIVQLEQIGRKIERHFGQPQDIEWCLMDSIFYIVQSRPITTLFPIPKEDDHDKHLYISVGHQQMMTDAIKPLGLSFWLLTTPASMRTAGGRLFVDIAQHFSSPAGRERLIAVLGKSDPLLKGALMTLAIRANDPVIQSPATENKVLSWRYPERSDHHPTIVQELIGNHQSSVGLLRQDIRSTSGVDLFDFILEDIRELKRILTDPQSLDIIMVAMHAASWINENMLQWLGETNAADAISQSLSNNITSEMGLALLDVADAIRPFPQLIQYLHRAIKDRPPRDNFLNELSNLGGKQVSAALDAFLEKYGMRCPGEIDITRTRWSEDPAMLIPMILSNIRNVAPNASHRKLGEGRQEASKKERELLGRLSQLPDGAGKAAETKKMIGLVRDLAGYREYPKYGVVSRYFIYKQALLKEAEQLVQTGVLAEKEDIFYCTFDEFREVVRTHQVDQQLIIQRKEEQRLFERLTPPRLITSDGEIIRGQYKREDLPAGALAGLAVSSGVIEGRARVIADMGAADVEEGDILVTTFTDPGWTPLFISIKGLVTEVGGLMTHGAVIAREYGLPAVVGVELATKLIRDGQRIRVNGTEGYVELL